MPSDSFLEYDYSLVALIAVFSVDAVNIAIPLVFVLPQHFFGRGLAAINDIAERVEEMSLVAVKCPSLCAVVQSFI